MLKPLKQPKWVSCDHYVRHSYVHKYAFITQDAIQNFFHRCVIPLYNMGSRQSLTENNINNQQQQQQQRLNNSQSIQNSMDTGEESQNESEQVDTQSVDQEDQSVNRIQFRERHFQYYSQSSQDDISLFSSDDDDDDNEGSLNADNWVQEIRDVVLTNGQPSFEVVERQRLTFAEMHFNSIQLGNAFNYILFNNSLDFDFPDSICLLKAFQIRKTDYLLKNYIPISNQANDKNQEDIEDLYRKFNVQKIWIGGEPQQMDKSNDSESYASILSEETIIE